LPTVSSAEEEAAAAASADALLENETTAVLFEFKIWPTEPKHAVDDSDGVDVVDAAAPAVRVTVEAMSVYCRTSGI
jgi:hypothetical protein